MTHKFVVQRQHCSPFRATRPRPNVYLLLLQSHAVNPTAKGGYSLNFTALCAVPHMPKVTNKTGDNRVLCAPPAAPRVK